MSLVRRVNADPPVVLNKRRSGILLPITALPSEFGIGDLGPGAYWFADFLVSARQSLWQILPLNPTDAAYQHSPYSSFSAFAGNPWLISPALLLEDDLLAEEDLQDKPDFPPAQVDYAQAIACKEKLLDKVYEYFRHDKRLRKEFRIFQKDNEPWLRDYALFTAIKKSLGGVIWTDWPDELKNRNRDALYDFELAFADQVDKARFLQFIFFRQWKKLRAYCHQGGVYLIGDMPIYVNWDSADAWAGAENFKIDAHHKPLGVAGVPPDYFSGTGQRWGNPVYDWEKLKASKYAWWIGRIRHNLDMYDYLRIDHFRGFVQCWEIPAHEPLASSGKWVEAPARDFLGTLQKTFKPLPVIAEDLGIITDDVREVMKAYGLPGMKVLLFAFGEDLQKHPYLPHNFDHHCVVYTGTHDNNTVRGWFDHEAGLKEKENFFTYIGRVVDGKDIHWAFIELALMSKADTAIVPMQDVLGLGQEARFNKPATTRGNWQWRVLEGAVDRDVVQRLRELTQRSHRT